MYLKLKKFGGSREIGQWLEVGMERRKFLFFMTVDIGRYL